MTGHLPSRYQALGSIPSTVKQTNNKQKHMKITKDLLSSKIFSNYTKNRNKQCSGFIKILASVPSSHTTVLLQHNHVLSTQDALLQP